MSAAIGGGKGGAMVLQLHLDLRVLHRIFATEIFYQLISPTSCSHLPPPL